MSGIICAPGRAWAELKSIEFHLLNTKTYDRRGRICSIIFGKFPNQDYQKESVTFAVRAITSLLAGHYTLQDLEEYAYDEMNDCWIYYNYPLEQHRLMCTDNDLVVVAVNHKYWGEKQIDAFRNILEAIAFMYDAPVVYT